MKVALAKWMLQQIPFHLDDYRMTKMALKLGLLLGGGPLVAFAGIRLLTT